MNKIKTTIFFILLFFSCYSQATIPLAIIGCGGSGTLYTYKCLQICGFDVGHERVKSFAYVGWPFVGGFYNCLGRPQPEVKFDHVFHQVRNPLNVIKTWCDPSAASFWIWRYIQSQIPEINHSDALIVKCAKYWYYWNLKAEEKAEWRYKVEDFIDLLTEFECRLNIRLNKDLAESIPKKTDQWDKRRQSTTEITWQMLQQALPTDLFHNIQTMAIRYEYSIED